MTLRYLLALALAWSLSGNSLAADKADSGGWTEQQTSKLPKSETPVHLFNGKDFSGWEGQTGKYFSIADGVIVAKNGKDDAPKASTYLVTKQKYRNFRLIFRSPASNQRNALGHRLMGEDRREARRPL